MDLFRRRDKPAPVRLTEAEKAASAARYLAQYAAKLRREEATIRRLNKTAELQDNIARGEIAHLGWRK